MTDLILCLGMELIDVIRAGTAAPAAALGRADIGRLDIGAVGNATVLELAEGEFEYRDVLGEVRLGRQRLNARGLVVAGRWWHCRVERGRGLTKALVEVAATLTSRDVDEDAVEDHALLFVLVEAEVEKLPQIPPALRRAEGIRPPNVTGARIAVLGTAVMQEGNGVACRQQTQPHHRSACRRVDQVINLARDEPGCEVNMVGVGNHPTGIEPGERRFLSRDCPRGRIIAIAHQQGGVIVLDFGAVAAVGKELNLARGVWLETDQKPAGDRTTFPSCLRNFDVHKPVCGRHIVLPAAPDDRVSHDASGSHRLHRSAHWG